ncbi:DUF2461 domain-containing protein [Microbacterium thalassium]|uniref:Uncharacterized protein (TIGR02453 family) n=1 Tax=Microbacterium thalassium TaxID=362649 RepID=A0A7X0FLE0_9MICO|nr:DUF2461 domain-containing protein [Microbacterium thalassium]MBB6389690.1 uncharacterized protein (TIGR02453 family) [Microbacterium thalassium]GLK24741.1 TIGR02453 family protein [Microbacterium thalassium]
MNFSGLNPDAPAFYAELRENNTKEWWTANKDRYERNVRAPFEAIGDELAGEFGPVKIFRPYRDVRFSADKSPYKLAIGMVTRSSPAHYLQLSEDGLMLGGGLYEATPAMLARFRAIVDDNRLVGDLEATLDEVGDAGFELMAGDALRTAPRGFSVDHPHIDLLRLKRLAVSRREPVAEWMWAPGALDDVRDRWRTVSIWCDWLSENLGDTVGD